MTTEVQQPRLFDQYCLGILCSKNLSREYVEQLATTLEEHGGESLIVQPGAEVPNVARFSHLISNTIDFEAYDTTPRSEGTMGQQLTGKDPDPRLFMNDVVVTCGDIPAKDKDAIIGGVVAKRGLYSPRTSHMVTHLVDLTADSDKARMAQAKKLNVKIVLPHWFDDCLKLGRRIDD
ncbi:hypothetical protein N7499_003079 [Penicillium canescens]|uniref:BRCT domain-containing protein n=1 Tax=Penicillium canescens TaxID=5083 RepID=A0AAD6N838_PENCN|nr:uncharacterized protein N7446_011952 [Penicillium canescens]KAJ6019818.1 hypothetical protein N7522_000526 [Penicillium canescens]KAJ6039113.1 hypothetical protein N7460_007145 [Penicillium canescens]KAJ6047118.1 hypothetical protein N7446_011952 [Penicillium canescens]KAJ6059870.1 hypothetical protein N7444_003509 [Penicillium canescens]KAJ6093748.1 hypothetical protein N7499_003079 [Penicillium canescens]